MPLLDQGRLAALALLVSIPFFAFADTDEPTPLPAVLVEQPRTGSLTAESEHEAARRAQRTPGAAQVVSAEEFADRYALSIKDMLGAVPGVYAQPRFAEEVRLSIRGSGLSRGFHLRGITLLQDGVPVNLADGSGDFQEIDPASYDYVEVYKGANALRYGVASLGGAIQFVTRTARTVPWQSSLRAEGGSFETSRLNVSGARAHENWDALGSLTLSSSAGYRESSRGDSQRLSGNVGYRLSTTAETRFYLGYNAIDQRIPGTLSRTDALENPTRASAANIAQKAARDIDSIRLANRTSLQLGDGRLDLSAYTFSKDLFHPLSFGVIDQSGDFHGVQARYEGRGSLGGYVQQFAMGAGLRQGDNDARVFANNGGVPGAQTANAREQAGSVDVFVENQFFLNPVLALVAGAHYVHASRDCTDRLNAARNDEKSYVGISPRIGVLYDATPRQQWFANLSRSYEPPTFSELNQQPVVGFVPVEAQTATTLELGTRGRGEVLSWELSLYRAQLRDELLQFTVTPNIPAATFNADRTLHQGIEAGLAWRIGGGFTLRQAYTYSDFRFEGDAQYGDRRLPVMPVHYYQAALDYAPASRFTLTPAMEWVPSGAYVDYNNTERTPGYAVFNLNADWSLSDALSLYLDARNLGDRRYLSNFSAVTQFSNQAIFYPGEGRALFAGLRWTL